MITRTIDWNYCKEDTDICTFSKEALLINIRRMWDISTYIIVIRSIPQDLRRTCLYELGKYWSWPLCFYSHNFYNSFIFIYFKLACCTQLLVLLDHKSVYQTQQLKDDNMSNERILRNQQLQPLMLKDFTSIAQLWTEIDYILYSHNFLHWYPALSMCSLKLNACFLTMTLIVRVRPWRWIVKIILDLMEIRSKTIY